MVYGGHCPPYIIMKGTDMLIGKISKYNDGVGQIITEEKTLINDKDNILKQLSDDDINLYDDKKNEYDLAFAMVTRKSCSNCFSGLPPQLFINVVERNISRNVFGMCLGSFGNIFRMC